MKCLVISFSDLDRDPRVKRQLQWIKELGFSVTTIGYRPSDVAVENHYSIEENRKKGAFFSTMKRKLKRGLQLLFRRYEPYFWEVHRIQALCDILRGEEAYDLIVVNDIDPLPAVCRYFRKGKIFLDLHEYAPGELSDNLQWRLLIQNYRRYLCQKYLPEADIITTVSDEIAWEYSSLCGVEAPHVITNASKKFDLHSRPTDHKTIRIVYHGICVKSRNTEKLIEISRYLDSRYTIDLILIPGDPRYIEALKEKFKNDSRIRFLEPVKMEEIVPFTTQYDIGLFLLPPVNFNYRYALPNKFFEFIQARLAVAIGPSPPMARLVQKYQCGVVADDFNPKTLADRLNSLTASDIDEMKKNSHAAARQLNAEANQAVFKGCLERVLEK